MAKFIYIAFLTLIGLSVAPPEVYACGSKSKNKETACSHYSETDSENNACCDTEKGQCNKHGNDCDGKCGNPSCHCPTNHTTFLLPVFIKLSGTKSINNKPNSYYQNSSYSSGYLSIWLPPKIG